MAGPLGLQPWQWWALGGVYLVAFAAPALWMARRAKRDGENVFVWTLLVAVGSLMGVIEYYEHRSVQKRRAAREERAKKR